MLFSHRSSKKQIVPDNQYYAIKLTQSSVSLVLSARAYNELAQLQNLSEVNQHRSTTNSIDFSRNISTKQSSRTSMPNLHQNLQQLKNKSQNKEKQTKLCQLFMPGLIIDDQEEIKPKRKIIQKPLSTPHLKSPLKHISFEFRNRGKATPKTKIN